MTANTHIRSTLLIGVALVALIAASQPASAISLNFTASGGLCLGDYNEGDMIVPPAVIVVYVPVPGGTMAFGYSTQGSCGSFDVDAGAGP